VIPQPQPPPEWSRLHPLSPLVRAGGLVVAAGFFILSAMSTPRSRGASTTLVIFIALAVVIVVGGVVSWLVTRWRIDGTDLQIESGLLRRQSLRIPLSRVQAVDVVVPLVARLLGLAEVRVVSAGRGAERGRLAYLGTVQAGQVRARLLALAHGLAPETPEPPAMHLFAVGNSRLVGALLLRLQPWVAPLLLSGPLIVAAAAAPQRNGWQELLFPALLLAALDVARVVNAEWSFVIGEAPDGLRLHRGLLQQRTETIPYGRIQAVRWVEPLLWRPFGWVRLEVDVARQGDPRRERESGARTLARTLCPVAGRAEAAWVLSRVFPGATPVPPAGSGVPSRALWRSPLSAHYLAFWHDAWYVAGRTGRLRPAVVITPLEKVQSVRRVQGPWLRALHLSTLHVDTAGHRWTAAGLCRDSGAAERLVAQLPELSRHARRARAATSA
jgi:putative membrane protein